MNKLYLLLDHIHFFCMLHVKYCTVSEKSVYGSPGKCNGPKK